MAAGGDKKPRRVVIGPVLSKERAIALGARWDPRSRRYVLPAGVDARSTREDTSSAAVLMRAAERRAEVAARCLPVVDGKRLIAGNTWPVRHRLRRLGGAWREDLLGYLVPEEAAGRALLLVDDAPRRGVSCGTCRGCGAVLTCRFRCAACGRRHRMRRIDP